jgi:predicted negative regulator of RcsB-dependent stress response
MDSKVIALILVIGMACWAAYQIWKKRKNDKKSM